jgi:chromosome segregation ATPase
MPTLSLTDLHRRISQHDSNLKALRGELESRQRQLAALTRRKEELRAQLQQVEAEMAGVTTGAQRLAAGTKKVVAKKKSSPKKPTPKPLSLKPKTDPEALSAFLLNMLREVGRPMTVSQMAAEAERRGFQSGSTNFLKLVENRTYALKKLGRLKRAGDKPGFVPVPSSSQGATPKAAPRPGTAKGGSAKR